ncbi:urea transporter, partial [Burkholderia sp. Ac-20349]|uniref:urea transporter n=1 Tax=Burkholderia sp. Ac-20349 TaxID=2703893 RepID=UPI001F11F13F
MPTARPVPPSIDLRILLRGIGQIVLQANAFTGALLLAALALTDLRLASAALVGSAAASMTAVLTGAERRDVEQGLHGFNGALAALIAVLFAPHQLAAVALVPLVSIGAALVQRAMRLPLARWRQCPYSSPCLIVTIRLARLCPDPVRRRRDARPDGVARDEQRLAVRIASRDGRH